MYLGVAYNSKKVLRFFGLDETEGNVDAGVQLHDRG